MEKNMTHSKKMNNNTEDNWETTSMKTVLDVKKEKIYDDIPDEETLIETDKLNIIKNLISPGKETIEKINSYLKKEKVPIVNSIIDPTIQTFTYEGKTYALEKEEILQYVTTIINQNNPLGAITKTLNRRPNSLLKNIKNYLTMKMEKNAIPIAELELIEKQTIITIIIRVLSLKLNHKMSSSDKYTTNFNKSTIAMDLGRTLLEAIITLKILYNTPSKEELNKPGIMPYPTKTLEEIKECLKQFEENKQNACDLYLKTKINNKFVKIIKASIQLYLLKNVKDFVSTIPIKEIETLIIKYSLIMGTTIVDWLITNNILIEFIANKKKNRIKIPMVTFYKQLDLDLLAVSSFIKPKIMVNDLPTVYSIKYNDKLTLKIHLMKHDISKSHSVTLYPEETMSDILDTYSNMPMSIDGKRVEELIDMLTKMVFLPVNPYNDELLNCINTIYELDLKPIRDNNGDNNLFIKVLSFAKDIIILVDKDLEEQIQNNIACQQAFNQLRSRKYNLIGVLNDLIIFKQFNKFYIPKYLTSTGRLYSKPFFIQLQGVKLVHGFIHFAKQQITDNIMERVLEILHKKLPDMKDKISTLTEYKREITGHYNDFVKAKLISNVNIRSYFDMWRNIIK